jgi:hypothetical protein
MANRLRFFFLKNGFVNDAIFLGGWMREGYYLSIGTELKKIYISNMHVSISELSTYPVHSHEQCVALMERGWAMRSVGATLMNADSSRSHCIFSVSVERMEMRDGLGNGSAKSGSIRRGKLNLVDLAGSERQAKTGKYIAK